MATAHTASSQKRHSFHLGVTGGIGSGKSTFAALLARHGAAHVDADALSRATTAAGGSAIAAIRAQFGDDFIDTGGALDRERMRALVFAEPLARDRLQAIIHPLVGEAIARATAQAEHSGKRLIALDLPLLTESSHWPARLDAVLVVDCQESTQIERVRVRSGLQPQAVEAIMAAQSSRAVRCMAADWVVYNDGLSLQQLEALAAQVATSLGA